MTLLMRREALLHCRGWDEALDAGQDRDFFISIAMSGADIRYQSGCHSVYRRYGNVTVSTASLQRWLESHRRLLEKVESKLKDTGQLKAGYRRALAQSYFSIARNYYDIDRSKYAQMLKKTLSLYPDFRPNGSLIYCFTQRVLGFEMADKLAKYRRSVLG